VSFFFFFLKGSLFGLHVPPNLVLCYSLSFAISKTATAKLISSLFPLKSLYKTTHKVAYLFNDYWEDIGTIKSFFEANLGLAHSPPRFEFYDPETPIYTSPRFLPPAKVLDCKVSDAIISHG